MKSIRPKRIDTKAIEAEIMNISVKHGKNVAKQYEKIMATWAGDKPDFPIKQRVEQGNLITSIIATGSGSEKMVFLDNGTRPHKITAKKAPNLAFQTGYKRKTKAKTIGSFSGGSFGPIRITKSVQHPGTEANEFSLTIAEQEQPQYVKAINKIWP